MTVGGLVGELGHDTPVLSLRSHPTDCTLVSVAEGDVRVWNVPKGLQIDQHKITGAVVAVPSPPPSLGRRRASEPLFIRLLCLFGCLVRFGRG